MFPDKTKDKRSIIWLKCTKTAIKVYVPYKTLCLCCFLTVSWPINAILASFKILTFFQTADCLKLDINRYSQLSLRTLLGTAVTLYCPSKKGAYLPEEWIAGFHIISLKFKLQNYRSESYWDFNFMMYKSWKITFIQIFASKGFLVLCCLNFRRFLLVVFTRPSATSEMLSSDVTTPLP